MIQGDPGDSLTESIVAQLSAWTEGPEDPIFAKLLAISLDEIRELLATMERLSCAPDAPGLRQVSHSLVGVSRNLGANALAKVAEAVELVARQGGGQPPEDLLRAALAEYEGVVAAGRKLMPRASR